jgi:hypothetical protein
MSFYDFLVSIDVRTALMERMMQKFSVDRQLKCLPHHAAVVSRAVDRCRSCGHQDACADWLEHNDRPDEPPDFCRNRDLIARLRHHWPTLG